MPGVEPLVAAAHELRPEKVSEFIEAVLVEWGRLEHDENDEDSHASEWEGADLLLPVDKAYEFGYVTAEERRQAMADARALTVSLPDGPFAGEPTVPDPVLTADARFRLLITRRRTRRTAKPMWVWPGGSVAAEAEKIPDEVIEWLAQWAYRIAQRQLQHTMEQAWHAGFDHHPKAFWRPGYLPDDPM